MWLSQPADQQAKQYSSCPTKCKPLAQTAGLSIGQVLWRCFSRFSLARYCRLDNEKPLAPALKAHCPAYVYGQFNCGQSSGANRSISLRVKCRHEACRQLLNHVRSWQVRFKHGRKGWPDGVLHKAPIALENKPQPNRGFVTRTSGAHSTNLSTLIANQDETCAV